MESYNAVKGKEDAKEVLKLKDLANRVYSGKTCTRFEYTATAKEGNKVVELFTARWKAGDMPTEWSMEIVFPRHEMADSQVYAFGYVMPKAGLPLELIAATGLRYFQSQLKQEIEHKMTIDFAIGDITANM